MHKRKVINKESKKDDDVVVFCARTRENQTDDAVDVVRFVEFFNRKVKENRSNVPAVLFLTRGRERMLRFLCKKYGKLAMISAVEYVTRNDFLNGRRNGRMLASLEWMLREDNFIRVLEDAFRDAPRPETPEARRERELLQHRADRQQEEDERRRREQERDQRASRAATVEEIRAILGENCVI